MSSSQRFLSACLQQKGMRKYSDIQLRCDSKKLRLEKVSDKLKWIIDKTKVLIALINVNILFFFIRPLVTFHQQYHRRRTTSAKGVKIYWSLSRHWRLVGFLLLLADIAGRQSRAALKKSRAVFSLATLKRSCVWARKILWNKSGLCGYELNLAPAVIQFPYCYPLQGAKLQ